MKPFFIVSAPRSGSTLLRLILDAHPRLAVPPPAWLFELVQPYLYSYGDLEADGNLVALAEDMLATPTIGGWPIQPTAEALVAASAERTFAGLYEALHRMYARDSGKARWGEKSPRNCFWIDEIRRAFPEAQFIHIVRDGRDMAVDLVDTPGMRPRTLYSAVHMWQAFVAAARESAVRLDPSTYYEIRYEALCLAPEQELRALCGFLEEAFDPSMLAHQDTISTRTWSSRRTHQRTQRPITTEFCGIHQRRLPGSDRAALDAVIGGTLRDLGYDVSADPRPVAPRLASQLLESDMVSSTTNAAYKDWHEERRRERRAQGIWRDTDRTSRLWGLD